MPNGRVKDGEALIVIGTAATVPAAAHALGALGAAAPPLAGAVLIEPARAAQALPCPILGSLDDLPALVRRLGIRTALVSLPGALAAVQARVRSVLREHGVQERFFPTMGDILTRDPDCFRPGLLSLDVGTLIGRQPRAIAHHHVRALLGGKRVLITGAGGSIGSELALRCAAYGPETLILMERSENALFEIDRRVASQEPRVERRAVLHDVVDAESTLRRMAGLRPDVVFHAAAHKHVPMMEDHPAAAVTNNLFGTKSVADAALAVRAARFVMVSTDKAVNPTSVMGATKRLAELYIRSLNRPRVQERSGHTHFSLVRFGNVLGSACSVLPIWSAQLAEGGPITVTHPQMTRYFMTIPEAASLVIQAATLDHPESPGCGDEVFVLDMGEPVRIRDLAERFVQAHGFEPAWEDPQGLLGGHLPHPRPSAAPSVRVVFTGPRPGEKLHEELAYQAEDLRPTAVEGILSWAGDRPDTTDVHRMVGEMSLVRNSDDRNAVLEALRRHVPQLSRNTPILGDKSAAA